MNNIVIKHGKFCIINSKNEDESIIQYRMNFIVSNMEVVDVITMSQYACNIKFLSCFYDSNIMSDYIKLKKRTRDKLQ